MMQTGNYVYETVKQERQEVFEELRFETDREVSPLLYEEFSRTVSDIARGLEPRTVSHVLLVERGVGLTAPFIAATVGRPTFEIERSLILLQSEGFVIRFDENGFEKWMMRGQSDA